MKASLSEAIYIFNIREKNKDQVHSSYTVVVTHYMIPSAWINKGGIPTLKDIIGVGEALLEGDESSPFRISGNEGKMC